VGALAICMKLRDFSTEAKLFGALGVVTQSFDLLENTCVFLMFGLVDATLYLESGSH
jgi:hypothetical protein